jgi:hypothetical protein
MYLPYIKVALYLYVHFTTTEFLNIGRPHVFWGLFITEKLNSTNFTLPLMFFMKIVPLSYTSTVTINVNIFNIYLLNYVIIFTGTSL